MLETDIKNTFNMHFEQFFKHEELCRWLHPLGLNYCSEQKILKISFPHNFFGEWFVQNIQTQFENLSKQCLPIAKFIYSTGEQSFVQNKGCKTSAPSSIQTNSFINNEEIKELANKLNIIGRIPSEDHTFTTFLVNKKNDFPLATAKESAYNAINPLYNPFTIFGQSGSGKTHLLEAIINTICAKHKNSHIFYGDGEGFCSFMQKENIHNIHTFFIDDAQNIIEKSIALQKIFIMQLDALHRAKKMVVIVIDSHPNDCSGILPKLKQRLNGGLVVKLKKPDVHIRRLYVQRTNLEFELGLTNEQVLILAQTYTDFRAIIGALTHIKAYKLLIQTEITDFTTVLGSFGEQKEITHETIICRIATYHEIKEEELISTSRNKKISFARQQAMYFCRELLGMPFTQIGHLFGDRDHSSVIYSVNKIKNLSDSNKDTHNELSLLKKMCLSTPAHK